jgi:hypothetical protein
MNDLEDCINKSWLKYFSSLDVLHCFLPLDDVILSWRIGVLGMCAGEVSHAVPSESIAPIVLDCDL